MIRLEKVYAKNVWDIIKLEVEESQDRFVASNKESIIDAYTTIGTDCSAFPFGIYDDEELVGFLMIGFNEAALEEIYEEEPLEVMKNNYLLWRLMVDKKYQKRGYGREAVKLALEFVHTMPCGIGEYCVTSYDADNEVARNLYASFGFKETGEIAFDEVIAVLKL